MTEYPLSDDHSPDYNGQRAEVLHRSLRHSNTSLSHYNPVQQRNTNSPTLTTNVRWSPDTEHTVPRIKRRYSGERHGLDYSDIDELDESEYETSTREQSTIRNSTVSRDHSLERQSPFPDTISDVSHSSLSDSDHRQPAFPGNRNIMDADISPTPSPQSHSAELRTPKEPDCAPYCEPNDGVHSPRTSLDEIHPSRRDSLERVGSWRLHQAQHREPIVRPLPRSRLDIPKLTREQSQRAPRSPPVTLPPIHHMNPPSYTTGENHQVSAVHPWELRESVSAPASYRSSHDSTSERSSSSSPQSLPPLLPHIGQVVRSYPPRQSLPPSLAINLPSGSQYVQTEALFDTPRDKKAWMNHVVVVPAENGQNNFRCMWPTPAGERPFCGYTAKRHLVKRHVETRHLQYRDHKCEFCGKAFPQRVSLDIHRNRHTGSKPHLCRYDGCDKSFSDPARRHKHMVEAHSYVPQGPRKKHRTVDSYHQNIETD